MKTILLTCSQCGSEFNRIPKNVKPAEYHFCNSTCHKIWRDNSCLFMCKQCGISIAKRPNELKKSKSGNTFCSQSCAAKYNNTHKTTGIRRSKLESWLEAQLIILYPNLDFKFNSKEEINSELDIYIPSLQLAFELNGIYHYEPIFGREKFTAVQNNDHRKFAACQDVDISLCIIDTSSQKHFTEKSSQKYLDIIIQILNTVPGGVEPPSKA